MNPEQILNDLWQKLERAVEDRNIYKVRSYVDVITEYSRKAPTLPIID